MAVGSVGVDLSIIIVNWNSLQFLRACLQSVRTTTGRLSYEVIVIDNLSTDSSPEALQSDEFAGIRVLCPGRNVGFARANNLGAKVAVGKALLFLNPDTVVLPDAIRALLHALSSDETIGIVGCKLLNKDLSLQTSCVLPFPSLTNQLLCLDVLLNKFPRSALWGIPVLDDSACSVPQQVPVVSGACLMVRRKTFEEVGGFSKEYFMYAEEVDLCHTAARLGWKTAYVGSVSVIHYGGQSSSQVRTSSFSSVLKTHSVYTFLRRTRGPGYAFAYRIGLLSSGLVRLAILSSVCLFVLPFWPDRTRSLRGAIVKWSGIAKWSIGLERWTERLALTADSGT